MTPRSSTRGNRSTANASGVRARLRKLLNSLFRRWKPASKVGRQGERVAKRELKRRGYRVLATNVVVPAGECDILCLAPDKRTLVVVEVKARGAGSSGPPPESRVGKAKSQKLLSVARSIARSRGLESHPLRIDVVGVDLAQDGKHTVRIFEGAVKLPGRRR